jgi:prevent-host-death family protein
METVGAHEARTQLPRLLERVMKGEQITITRHGVPVAVIQSPEKKIGKSTKSAIEKIKKFRTKHSLSGLSIRELIETGRR